ncbi:hypothetical protein D5F01_LYC04300 [Larimichthys crocea]|uniref:Uncharacterized protein n=1 Tax=Larimichthys crocea TaxID=215358 RepID=A0A6G0J2G3_LARCR|nr:hypothetical protein D5F01_LYC04300 [Larimichthys crocea]
MRKRAFRMNISHYPEGCYAIEVKTELEAGSLLGRDGDTEWVSKHHTDPMTHGKEGELEMNFESKTGETNSTEVEKGLMEIAANKEASPQSTVWIKFACQARNNVAVQCSCGEVCLRVCQDIRPGTELLLYEDTAGTMDGRDAQDAGHTENKVEDKKDPATEVPNISIVQEKEGETKGGQ